MRKSSNLILHGSIFLLTLSSAQRLGRNDKGLRSTKIAPTTTTENSNNNKISSVLQFPLIAYSNITSPEFIEELDVVKIKKDEVYFFIRDENEYKMYTKLSSPSEIQIDENLTRKAILSSNPNSYSNNLSKRTTTIQYNHKQESSSSSSSTSSSQYFGRADIPIYPIISESMTCYRSLMGSYSTMQYLSQKYPDLVDVFDIGNSYYKSIGQGGFPIWSMRITNKLNYGTVKQKPPLFILCTLHPREIVTSEICARFAEGMLMDYGSHSDKTWIIDYTEIHIIMQANPDGRFDEETNLHYRRKNMNPNKRRCYGDDGTKRGVDLNRNFPHWAWGKAGVGGRCDPNFPGSSAGSEPEIQAIVKYIERVLPRGKNKKDQYTGSYLASSYGVLIDIHSFGRDIFWPYAFSPTAKSPNDVDLEAFAKKMSFYTYPVYDTENESYPTSGDSTDFFHDSIGVAAFTVEVGTWFYEDCSTFEQVESANILRMLLYAARVSKAPYKFPQGPDITEIRLSPSTLSTADTLTVFVRASDSERAMGFRTGGHEVSSITIYVDSHPFDVTLEEEEDNSLIISAAVDDETDEFSSSSITSASASFDVSLTDLNPGKHILYVQARDIHGLGPVYSTYFNISPM